MSSLSLTLLPNSNPRKFSLSLSLQIQTLENFLTQTLSPLHQKPLRLYIYSYLTPSLSLFLSHFLSNKTNLNHTTKQTNSNGLKNTAKCNATTHSYAISWNQLGERSTSHQASKSNWGLSCHVDIRLVRKWNKILFSCFVVICSWIWWVTIVWVMRKCKKFVLFFIDLSWLVENRRR